MPRSSLPSALAIALLTACGASPSVVEWPPPLPAEVRLEPTEPAELGPTHEVVLELEALARGEVPVGPVSEPADGDLVEVVEGELEGIRYLEIIFGEAEDHVPLPTIWILHGRGDVARVPGWPFWDLPTPVRVFVPQAPTPLGEGFTWLPVRVAEGRTEELAAALEVMARRLAHLIEVFAEARPTLGRPIVAGFSQGGLLSFTLALRHPEQLARAFPSAGWIPPSLVPDLADPARFPPIRALHGTEDERIPIGPTRELVARLQAAGLDVELVEAPGVGHEMSPEMAAQLRAWLEEAVDRATALDPSDGD